MRNKDGSRHMHRIIEVCLLVLLCRLDGEKTHGYALGEQLTEFGFDESEISVSTLYRTLRAMEGAGWVTSDWAAGGQGPQRRQYTITDAGRQALDRWAAVLLRRQERINRMLKAYAQLGRTPTADVMPPAQQEKGHTQALGDPDEEPVENKPAPAPQREESFIDYWD